MHEIVNELMKYIEIPFTINKNWGSDSIKSDTLTIIYSKPLKEVNGQQNYIKDLW